MGVYNNYDPILVREWEMVSFSHACEQVPDDSSYSVLLTLLENGNAFLKFSCVFFCTNLSSILICVLINRKSYFFAISKRIWEVYSGDIVCPI